LKGNRGTDRPAGFKSKKRNGAAEGILLHRGNKEGEDMRMRRGICGELIKEAYLGEKKA